MSTLLWSHHSERMYVCVSGSRPANLGATCRYRILGPLTVTSCALVDAIKISLVIPS